ncbi:tripartite tricarboxylate transporter TctB family protein [Nesterenkonia muleiensis]|uniref:tripartite tricarboxylate transporter TctB family protein n=1 Tax=Nesterenkonia muleiensis TaxID=2282648 RepID=UPI000E7327FC
MKLGGLIYSVDLWIFSYLLTCLAIGIYFLLGATRYAEGPAMFPSLLSWSLIGVACCQILLEIVRDNRAKEVPKSGKPAGQSRELRGPILASSLPIVLLLAFVIAVPYLGTYVSIGLFMVLGSWLAGKRKLYVILLLTVITVAGVYLIFDYFLRVPLPGNQIF